MLDAVKRLLTLKQKENMTNKHLAEKLGYTEGAVRSWFKGRRTPSRKAESKINSFLRGFK